MHAVIAWALKRWMFIVHMAVGQNLGYLFGDGYHPIVDYLKDFLGCSLGYRGFDHGHVSGAPNAFKEGI